MLQNDLYQIHFVTKILPNSFCYKMIFTEFILLQNHFTRILPNSFCYKMICTEFILLQNDFYQIHFVTKWLCTEFILYYKMCVDGIHFVPNSFSFCVRNIVLCPRNARPVNSWCFGERGLSISLDNKLCSYCTHCHILITHSSVHMVCPHLIIQNDFVPNSFCNTIFFCGRNTFRTNFHSVYGIYSVIQNVFSCGRNSSMGSKIIVIYALSTLSTPSPHHPLSIPPAPPAIPSQVLQGILQRTIQIYNLQIFMVMHIFFLVILLQVPKSLHLGPTILYYVVTIL